MSFAENRQIAAGDAVNSAGDSGTMQYSASAVSRLSSSIAASADHGAQMWHGIGQCPAGCLGVGFESFAHRFNAAVEAQKSSAIQAYARLSDYAPAVSAQWQQFDEVDGAAGEYLGEVGAAL